MEYRTGAMQLTGNDLESGGMSGWGHHRSFSSRNRPETGHHGNWFVEQIPSIAQSGNLHVLITGANKGFIFTGSGPTYVPLRFNNETLTKAAGEYVFTDTFGNQTRYFDFTNATVGLRGQFKEYRDASSSVTTPTYAGSVLSSVSSSITVGGTTSVVTYTYTYNAAGLIDLVVLSHTVAGAPKTVRQASYEYYTGSGINNYGPENSLKLVTIKDGQLPTPEILECYYYRYYLTNNANEYIGGLKYAINPASYKRMLGATPSLDPTTASDIDVKSYADNFFEYDTTSRRVTKEVVNGTGCSCTGGGQGSFAYAYASSAFATGYNTWDRKTTEQQLDMSGIPLWTRVVYTNYAGEPMLEVLTADSQVTRRHYQYDTVGRLILEAWPSAVASYNSASEPADLGVVLNATTGLIRIVNYPSTTTAVEDIAVPANNVPGSVIGLIANEQVMQGSSGTPITTMAFTYWKRTVAGGIIYPLANKTTYRNTDGTGGMNTRFDYAWIGSTAQMTSMTTTKAIITAAQNGPGTADVEVEVYDSLMRVIWQKDANDRISYTDYDPGTGAVLKTIVDVNSATTTDFVGTCPWTSGSSPLHLMTTYLVDGLGRTTKITNPRTHVSYTVFYDPNRSSRTYPGFVTGAPATTVGPIRVHREDRAGSYTEDFTMSTAPEVTGGLPNGTELITGLQSLTRVYHDGGGRVLWRREYYNLTGLTYSTARDLGDGTNYHQTTYGYDPLGNMNRMVNAVNTIYRTVFDKRSRKASEWVGNNDSVTGEWSPTNNAGTSNMIMVRSYEYDGGGAGDGNLTKVTGVPSSTPSENRVRQQWFDWRNRLRAIKDGCETTAESTAVNRPMSYFDLDNNDQVTATSVYDADGITSLTVTNGVPQKPSASVLRRYSTVSFDDQGRPYRSAQSSVDPVTGAVGASLATNVWYDRKGQLIKSLTPGGLATKSVFDGSGRVTKKQQTDAGGDTAWLHAFDAAGDAVLHQENISYDGNGNVIQVFHKDRNHDDVATGDLANPTVAPKCVQRIVTAYWDPANRCTAKVSMGTNGSATAGVIGYAAFTRPGTVPARSDTVLVTSCAYSLAGYQELETDPRGIVLKQVYDALGREIRRIEGFDASVNGGNPSGANNRTTVTTYNGIGKVRTVQALMPTGTNSQTTEYVYSAGVLAGDFINSNDLLTRVRYPDPTTGAPSFSFEEIFMNNALGQVMGHNDGQNFHDIKFDLTGRKISDATSALGTGVNGAVKRIETAFDSAGRAYLFTSYDAVSAGVVVNQVQRAFNGLGQTVTEWQAVTGAVVTGTSPKVGYSYTFMASGANHSRWTMTTYPNGRVLRSEYSAGVDAAISRVSFLADGTTSTIGVHVEDYNYLGLSRIIRRGHPQPGIDLTYLKQGAETSGDSGDQYTGFDRFGRIIDQRWRKTSDGSHTDRFQYGYDRSSQKLFKNNLVSSVKSELYHANGVALQNSYDPLDRMTSFSRGTLSASGTNGNGTTLDSIVTAVDPNAADPIFGSQVWALGQTNNWNTVTSDGSAVARTHDSQNRLTAAGATTYGYDPNGNLTTQTGMTTNTWDGWNRAASIRGTTYSYDALGRRIKETVGANSRSFHHSGWQVVETRSNANTRASEQFIYGLAYIDEVILRDRDADGSPATGILGIAASGLEERLYFQQDALYHVTALISIAGVVNERMLYDPYGCLSYFDAAWVSRAVSSYSNNFGLTGRWHDATGMIYFRARYYEPVLGRFVSRDPKSYVDGMSLYAGYFVPNSSDPSGMSEVDLTIASDAAFTWGVDIKNPSDLGDAYEKIIKKLKPCDCIRNLKFLGHGNYPGSNYRRVGIGSINGKNPSPTTPPGLATIDIGASWNFDQASGQYIFGLEQKTIRFFTMLKPRLCDKSYITLYACNAGVGEEGRAFIQQIANLTGSLVEAPLGDVSGSGFTFAPFRARGPNNGEFINTTDGQLAPRPDAPPNIEPQE